MMSVRTPALALVVLALPASAIPAGDVDSDRDGLSDFHELHKHRTHPKKADSDGDGVPDGDWLERREYAYTVRVVVQVMKPVTLAELTDDFQDARLLDEGATHVELEAILYPFSTANDALEASDRWRPPARELERWLEPGPTSDVSSALKKRITSDLRSDGIDIEKLSDRETVERVSDWLMRRAEFHDGFTTFLTAFDERGRPYVPDELAGSVTANAGRGLSLEQQWQREISAAGMYEHRMRGSCTSSAIYLSGCLRAVGIPTRTVLCIPLVDANDERERDLVGKGLQHPRVHRIVQAATEEAVGAWTSHTFNEVWVGGRWRRLNYSKLGQGILDRQYLGLMIHVGTFHDWADARMPETVGRRQKLDLYDDLFGGPNPYSTISLRDALGTHCKDVSFEADALVLRVRELLWSDAAALPTDIVEGCARSGRFGLIAVLRDLENQELVDFFEGGAPDVWLEADGRTPIATRLDPGCWWFKDGTAYVYLPLDAGARDSLERGVAYRARAGNTVPGYTLELELEVTRP
jgi:hypothetical protein